MKIEMRSIAGIRPYENNPRSNDAAVDAVAESIREFGFRQPIVVDGDGVIVVGHTRYKAALKLGLAEVPVHVADGLTPAQLKAYRLADNQTARLSEWDQEKLIRELTELQSMDIDLDVTGFSSGELLRLIQTDGTQGQTDPDAIPDPPDEPTTKSGDLWILGRHRLLCGDSSENVDVDRLLDGSSIHLVNTDPPYNVKVEPRSNNAIAAGLSSFKGTNHHQAMDLARHPEKAQPTAKKLRAKDRPLANDFLSDDEFHRQLNSWFANLARVLLPGVWDKEHPVLTRKDFMGAFEICFYGWREGAGHRYFGPKNVTDLWHIKKVNPQNMIHLTEKPVELATRALQYSSKRGENVLDLFAGSGSTLIAAELTGRRAYLMEIDALYCDVIVRRWEEFTGKKAKRSSSATA